MTTTQALIEELKQRAESEGTWTVTSDELADRYDSVDYYRAVYETAQVSTELYGPDNAGELLVLLAALTGRDYRDELRDAGLFLSHEDRIELTERFVRVVRRAVVVHIPEPETFRAMLREFRRYDRAEFVYLSTFFNTDELVERCSAEYMDLRDAPALRATVESYLRLLLQRHIVDLHELAPALLEILRTVARHEGMLPGGRVRRDEEARARQDAGPGGHGEADGAAGELHARKQALSVLGITSSNPTKGEIRDRYRRLMRKYHPDINPRGLETAKAINNAYGLLITSAGRA
jgi:tRNA threonylcarbamoyladenosine modification (KEOPS) complex  Pcc1 subunit